MFSALPISSRVKSLWSSIKPKRILITSRSRGLSWASTSSICALKSSFKICSNGLTELLSSTKSPYLPSSSLPIGASTRIGSFVILITYLTLSMLNPTSFANSSMLGSLPCSCMYLRVILLMRFIVSIMCIGMRMVRA